jgi:hypothetical protein
LLPSLKKGVYELIGWAYGGSSTENCCCAPEGICGTVIVSVRLYTVSVTKYFCSYG